MKKILCIALSVVLLIACLGLTSCGGDDEITLIKDGKAQFKVVYASSEGKTVRSAANALVKDLDALGVSIEDAVTDSDVTEKSECEIIIGASVKNRDDDCLVNVKDLGEFGYVIKAVGSRIIIAAGSEDALDNAMTKFKSEYLGITDGMESLKNASVSATLFDEFIALYTLTAFTIDGVSIEDFTFAYDYGTSAAIAAECPKLDKYIRQINDAMGYEIPNSVKASALDSSAEHKFIVKYVSDAGSKGFRAYAKDGDFIIECSYWNAFDKTVNKFFRETLFEKKGNVELDGDFKYEHDVTVVRYSEFGAVGDGKTNDIEAIVATHEYANKCGQKIVPEENDGRGLKYYISDTNKGLLKDKDPEIIFATIKTDTNFGSAEFIIDDDWHNWGDKNENKTEAYASKDYHIFYVKSDNDSVELSAEQITALNGGVMPNVPAYTTSLSWLKSEIPAGGAMLLLKNDDKKDYIRFGGNSNSGSNRAEVILVDKDGNVDATTPITFDFDKFTSITVFSIDDKPITVEGGVFTTINNRVSADTNLKNKCNYWARGFGIERSNVTVKNLRHKMENEPTQVSDKLKDTFNQAYPYVWISIKYNNNAKLENCDLTGHKVYREDERDRSNAITDMGTYDFELKYTINPYIKNVTQSATPIHDAKYWGITGSNWTRNITFDGCKLSRFDAHCGFWNATIKDCELGAIINVIGGGTLNIINTVRYTGDSFITLRGDYGATFQGDIYIKDCTLKAVKAYTSVPKDDGTVGKYDENDKITDAYVIKANQIPENGIYSPDNTQFKANYFTHDFGYECYMPATITLDNFKSEAVNTYMFSDLYNQLFRPQSANDKIYHITEKVVYKNMDKMFALTRKPTTYTDIANIPQVKE